MDFFASLATAEHESGAMRASNLTTEIEALNAFILQQLGRDARERNRAGRKRVGAM
jgi:hypothetical protein